MTRITKAAIAGTLAAGLAAMLAGEVHAQTRTFDWSGSLASGQTLEVKGVNGAVRAEGAPGREASVRARIEGRRDDPSSVEVEVVEHDRGVTLCAIYPGEDTRCAPGDEGTLKNRDSDVQVHFEVRVPEGVRFSARTVNGSVDARRLRGDVTAHTVNGEITVSTSGSARARTVNGAITAEMGALSGRAPLRFETVNGGITLTLPDRAGAEVEARTLNGGISTDFPLTVQGRFGPRSLRGTIGGGGTEIRLRTTNGRIELRRAG